jgi:hypothetical protein
MGRMKELSAELEQALRAGLIEKALRDVIEAWEQGGSPIEIDAAMNRAADVLDKEV